MAIKNLIQLRKGSSSEWSNANPILASGEPGYDLTNNIIKVGDGVTAWNNLSGIGSAVASSSGSVDLDTTLIAGTGISFNYDSLSDSLYINISGNYASINHTHNINDITNFSSGVSGLLAVTNIIGGSNVAVTSSGSIFTVAVTGQLGLDSEQVDDRVSQLLTGGYGVNLNYNDNSNLLTISTTGLQPSGNYSIIGHTHSISDIFSLQTALDSKQPSGSYASSTHSHSISDITGLQTSLDSKQPSGNYASSSHTHTSSQITDFNSSVSGLINNIYAPLNSPILTGIPLAPTATSGTNSNQIASTAFVRTEINNLISSAPSTLDTLNELATALGNDANFSTTVTNSLANKANLTGATFTGSITAPTGNFTASLQVNGTGVSLAGHTHIIGDVTGLQAALDNKQVSGSYALSSHTHSSSQITDFNTSVSGLISGIYAPLSGKLNQFASTSSSELMSIIVDETGSGVLVFNNSPTITGLLTGQSGNFTTSLKVNNIDVSISGHTHTASSISDSTTAGRALITAVDASAQRTNLGLGTLATQNGTFSGSSSGINTGDQTISIGGDVTAAGSTGSLTATVTRINGVALSGLSTGLLKNTTGTGAPTIAIAGTDYAAASHTHTVSDISNFNSSVSGLLPVTNIVAGTNITTINTSGSRTISVSPALTDTIFHPFLLGGM